MIRCSRPMSWADASTWLIGSRRSTSLRPAASVTSKVMFDRPPAMSSKLNGPRTPGMLRSSQSGTRWALMPVTPADALSTVVICCPSTEPGLQAAHAAQPALPVGRAPLLVGRDLRVRQDQEPLVRHAGEDHLGDLLG